MDNDAVHSAQMLRDFLDLLEFAERLLVSSRQDERHLTQIYAYISLQMATLVAMVYMFIRSYPSAHLSACAAIGGTVEFVALSKMVLLAIGVRDRIRRNSESMNKSIALIREIKATILGAEECSPILRECVRVRVEQFGI